MENRPLGLEGYLKTLRKGLKLAQVDFWKEMKAAEVAFHKEMVAAMRDYEKTEYSDKRIPGTLAAAAKGFNERYEVAYQDFGKATKQSLEQFEKKIEELVGV